MKRKILIVIYIILIFVSLKLLYNITLNNSLISKYENGKYDKSQARGLTYLNFSQSYVANYNYGNILYQNGEYESAIEEYIKALKGNAPKYKECSIRINYALALCKTVKENSNDQDSINDAIKKYQSAINILTENGCANKNDSNGHSKEAEQLKRDIQKEIERLKTLKEYEPSNDGDDEKDKIEKEIDTIKDKIQNIKEEATKEQKNIEGEFREYNKEFNMKGKNW